MTQPSSSDLMSRTLRMTAILVGACVLFVGTLSTVAVVIANKVTASGGSHSTDSSIESPSPNKTPPAAPRAAGMKSQSI